MARVYEHPVSNAQQDLEGSELKSFDPVTRKALLKFWISAIGIVVAAFVLYLLSRGKIEPRLALIFAFMVATLAMILLFVMNRSLHKMHVVTKGEAKVDRRIEHVLSQLDDRFAVFNGVRARDAWLDHLLVGPSGAYAIKSSATLDKDGWARSGDIEQLLEETAAAQTLLTELLPEASLRLEPVLCVPAGSTVRVEQSDTGVWIVPAEKLAVALIKRSSAEGSIGRNVNETGAFSSNTMQAAAIELALASHWNIPTRKTRADYVPPTNMTGEPEVS